MLTGALRSTEGPPAAFLTPAKPEAHSLGPPQNRIDFVGIEMEGSLLRDTEALRSTGGRRPLGGPRDGEGKSVDKRQLRKVHSLRSLFFVLEL